MDTAAKRLWRQQEGPEISSRSVIVPDLEHAELSDKLPDEVREGVQLVTLSQFLADAPEPEAVAAT